jgi:histidinol-phosphate aminotransferase
MSQLLRRRDFLAFTAIAAAAGAQTGCASRPVAATAATPAAVPKQGALIVLSGNENPYGPGPKAQAAVLAAMPRFYRYNDDHYFALLDELARFEAVPRDQVVLGTGSGELLHMAALAYVRSGELLCAWPTYEQIMEYAEKVGGGIRKVPLDALHRHDLAALAAAVTRDTKLIYICNPNNPTGTVVPGAALREFCRKVGRTVPVLIDEAYIDLADRGATESMVDLARSGENVLVLKTFSKLHGLAGLRIGYGIGSREVIKTVKNLQMAFPNTAGIEAARASLEDREFLERARAALQTDRKRIVDACRALGRDCADAQGNFVFVHTRMPIKQFQSAMLAQGIEVGRAFAPYLDWCRISVGTQSETARLIAALRTVLAE